MNTDKKYLFLLCLILLIKAVFVWCIIYSAEIGLGPDEAQYWTWSRDLAWGYYSKPPGIAWQIWLGCKLFGNTELGIRFSALIISFFLSFSIYLLARICRLTPQTAFCAGAAFAITPLGMLSSLLAITDGGIVLFWTLACIVVAKALASDKTPSYVLLGFVLLAGALFKWQIYFFWPLILLGMLFFARLRSFNMIWGIIISLAGLTPSIIWNYTHHWATFRHVLTTMEGGQSADIGTTPLAQGNLLDFFGAQVVLISPIFFLLLIFALLASVRKSKGSLNPPLAFCGFAFFAPFILYTMWSCFTKLQGNWVDYIYPSAMVFLCWYAFESVSWGRIWFKTGAALSLFLCLIALSIPYIQSYALFSRFPIPYRINPFRHNVGWNQLEKELAFAGYNPQQHFLFGDKYQMSSILSFYSKGQKRAYFLNIQGVRKNQFSYWPSMAQEQLGQTGFFVLAENAPQLERDQEATIEKYQKTLSQYFDEVQFLGIKPLFMSYGIVVKGAYIFKCLEYNGKEPRETNLY